MTIKRNFLGTITGLAALLNNAGCPQDPSQIITPLDVQPTIALYEEDLRAYMENPGIENRTFATFLVGDFMDRVDNAEIVEAEKDEFGNESPFTPKVFCDGICYGYFEDNDVKFTDGKEVKVVYSGVNKIGAKGEMVLKVTYYHGHSPGYVSSALGSVDTRTDRLENEVDDIRGDISDLEERIEELENFFNLYTPTAMSESFSTVSSFACENIQRPRDNPETSYPEGQSLAIYALLQTDNGLSAFPLQRIPYTDPLSFSADYAIVGNANAWYAAVAGEDINVLSMSSDLRGTNPENCRHLYFLNVNPGGIEQGFSTVSALLENGEQVTTKIYSSEN